MPLTLLNDISHYYLKTILRNVRKIRAIGKQSELLKKRLEVILDTVDEAILAVDSSQTVLLFNQAAEKMLSVKSSQVLGQQIDDIMPGTQLASCLQAEKGMRHELTQLNDHYFFLNANLIADSSGLIDGMVATLQPVQKIQELDTQIRRELKIKGNRTKYSFADIKGSSPELAKAIAIANRFAKTELTILLEAESGTGKELFAQSIHNASPRCNGPFVAVNFAAIPDSLVESELFGYEDGAFTGAKKGGRPGLFEEAHTGTIFLDEIASASPEVQKRLLRVIEEREVRRLGSGRITPVDVRIIAATNVSLEQLIATNRFRQDLFYRLCTLPIAIPPLRARKSDIMDLVGYFAAKQSPGGIRLDERLSAFLCRYDWPGNVRELQNAVNYLCSIVKPGQPAGINDLLPYLAAKVNAAAAACPLASGAGSELPPALRQPGNLEFAGGILAAVKKHTRSQNGAGWKTLLAETGDQCGLSEHLIKKWLKLLNGWGYVATGKTRQGTRITPKGEQLLACRNQDAGRL